MKWHLICLWCNQHDTEKYKNVALIFGEGGGRLASSYGGGGKDWLVVAVFFFMFSVNPF